MKNNKISLKKNVKEFKKDDNENILEDLDLD